MTTRDIHHRRLRLDRRRGLLGGVCAGFARWCGVDPTWVRVALLLVALFATKLAIIAYAIGWLVLDD